VAIRDLFRRGRPRVAADPADLEHLRRWCATRVGIEAFLEPETLVSVPGLCLVAFDGEWTRRPVGDVATARRVAGELDVPLFDVLEEGRRAVERRERRERLREQMRTTDEA
jgi:hypothetical protein